MMQTNTTAYQIGHTIGLILGPALFLALFGFFIFSLIKAIMTKKAGWIIGACLAGLPVLLFIALLLIGFVRGFKQGYDSVRDRSSARRDEPSVLLNATMHPIIGNHLPYSISLPNLVEWKKNDARDPFDHLFNYHEAYVGVIAEGIGMGSTDKLVDFTRKNLAERADSLTTTPPHEIQIDGHTWTTYDAGAVIKGIKIKYRYYLYSDEDYSFQIMTWTGTVMFTQNAPVFDRIAQSFKMPPPPK